MQSILKYFINNSFITRSIESDIKYYYEISEEFLLEAYNDAFLRLFRRVIKQSPFYRNWYQEHGIHEKSIKDINDIKLLPEIDKQILLDSTLPIHEGFHLLRTKGYTSGTKGSPLTTFRTPLSIMTEKAYINQYREIHGFKQGEPLLSIRGALGKNDVFIKENISNTLFISGPNLNDQSIHSIYKKIVDFKPKAIEAFPSYLHSLVQLLEKNQLRLEIPLTFTSSEMLYDFQRNNAENYLQTKIFDWYGNVERSIALSEDKFKKYKPLPLYSINEYRQNELVTTALNNYYFPLIRYRVDDCIQTHSNDFLKNLINPDIISIQGRVGDVIDLPDGSAVACVDHAFKGIKGLKQAQVLQQNKNEIDVHVHTSTSFTDDSQMKLRNNLVRMLGTEININIRHCELDQFYQEPGKKYRLIIKPTFS